MGPLKIGEKPQSCKRQAEGGEQQKVQHLRHIA